MPRLSRPRHCGRAMREVTESDERALGIHAWICDTCKFESQSLHDYGEPRPRPAFALTRDPNTRWKRGGRGVNRDPLLFGIVRRAQRFEARIASGKGGVWIYLGLFRYLGEAIRARDEALRRRKMG